MKSIYESASKTHIEKNIKMLTRLGFMFKSKFLADLNISKNEVFSILKGIFQFNYEN